MGRKSPLGRLPPEVASRKGKSQSVAVLFGVVAQAPGGAMCGSNLNAPQQSASRATKSMEVRASASDQSYNTECLAGLVLCSGLTYGIRGVHCGTVCEARSTDMPLGAPEAT